MKFQKGNPGGPGRPPKSKEDAYLNAIRDTFTPAQMIEVIAGLLNNSLSWRARHAGVELILHYLLGKPTQRVMQATITPDEWLAAVMGTPTDDDNDD